MWFFKEDCFVFEGFSLFGDVVFIKRVILSFIVRFFDFIGFFTLYVLMVKCMF